jgi:hypothetical protein
MNRMVVASALLLTMAPFEEAVAENARSIALVLDASGSMAAELPDGTTRIEAAKAAVADLVGTLPAETRLSLRAYGHRSPKQQKDCEDTELLVPFGAVGDNKSAVIEAARGVEARGYTPITTVLKLAAEDIAREDAGSRVVVLVSDGKETCQGDPCATAKALADADVKLVVHTVGVGVDAGTRFQLQCIADMARGTYFDAATGSELARVLAEASQKEAAPVTTEIVVSEPKPGRIEVRGASRDGHEVIDAVTGQRIEVTRPDTGQKVDSITQVWPLVELPAGIYNVTFANALWMGIEVKAGETTVLEPGVLEIKNADFQGHKVLEPETDEVVAELLSSNDSVALIPSRFSVTFGELVLPDVEIKPGDTTVLNPGVIHVQTSSIGSYEVTAADGQRAGEVGTGMDRLALPAGKYMLALPDQNLPIELHEGEIVEITVE